MDTEHVTNLLSCPQPPCRVTAALTGEKVQSHAVLYVSRTKRVRILLSLCSLCTPLLLTLLLSGSTFAAEYNEEMGETRRLEEQRGRQQNHGA